MLTLLILLSQIKATNVIKIATIAISDKRKNNKNKRKEWEKMGESEGLRFWKEQQQQPQQQLQP